MSKEIMALRKYAGNEIILPYPGDKHVFLQQIGNAAILKAQKFEKPDILVPLSSKILAIEHFEFDASVVDKKGSSEKREESFLGKQFDKKIAELSPEQTFITSTNSYGCRYSKEDYIKNFKNNFTSHYEKVEEYKKHIVDEGLAKNNEEIGMAFFIIDTTALGSFYETENTLQYVAPCFTPECREVMQNAKDIDYYFLGCFNGNEDILLFLSNCDESMNYVKENYRMSGEWHFWEPHTARYAEIITNI